jgi:hypothetical protein
MSKRTLVNKRTGRKITLVRKTPVKRRKYPKYA